MAMFEPELERGGPRHIRRRWGHGKAIGFFQIFLIPHTLIGIWLACAAVYMTLTVTLVALFGQVVPGRITGREDSSGETETTYFLTYTYRYGDRQYTGKASVGTSGYPDIRDGAPVSVKVFPPAPGLGSHLIGYAQHNIWLIWLVALFWNAILYIFVQGAYIAPYLARKLVVWGHTATGHVTAKSPLNGDDSSAHVIHYEFLPVTANQPAAVAEPFRETMFVKKAVWDTVQVGDTLTVLYDPQRPTRSLLYRFADYRALP